MWRGYVLVQRAHVPPEATFALPKPDSRGVLARATPLFLVQVNVLKCLTRAGLDLVTMGALTECYVVG